MTNKINEEVEKKKPDFVEDLDSRYSAAYHNMRSAYAQFLKMLYIEIPKYVREKYEDKVETKPVAILHLAVPGTIDLPTYYGNLFQYIIKFKSGSFTYKDHPDVYVLAGKNSTTDPGSLFNLYDLNIEALETLVGKIVNVLNSGHPSPWLLVEELPDVEIIRL